MSLIVVLLLSNLNCQWIYSNQSYYVIQRLNPLSILFHCIPVHSTIDSIWLLPVFWIEHNNSYCLCFLQTFTELLWLWLAFWIGWLWVGCVPRQYECLQIIWIVSLFPFWWWIVLDCLWTQCSFSFLQSIHSLF